MLKVVKTNSANSADTPKPIERTSKLLESTPLAVSAKCEPGEPDKFRVELKEMATESHQFLTMKHSPVVIGQPGTPWVKWQVIERTPAVCIIQFINKGPAKTIEVSFA